MTEAYKSPAALARAHRNEIQEPLTPSTRVERPQVGAVGMPWRMRASQHLRAGSWSWPKRLLAVNGSYDDSVADWEIIVCPVLICLLLTLRTTILLRWNEGGVAYSRSARKRGRAGRCCMKHLGFSCFVAALFGLADADASDAALSRARWLRTTRSTGRGLSRALPTLTENRSRPRCGHPGREGVHAIRAAT
jgi:hypothetical protein